MRPIAHPSTPSPAAQPARPTPQLLRRGRLLGPLPLLLASLLLGQGCEGTDAAPVEVAVFDSAGVTIVANPADAEERVPRWTVDPDPLLRIGVVEGEEPYEFAMLHRVVGLADGGVATLDVPTRQLRIFDPSGGHRATAGGAGEGPGEFQLPQGPWRFDGDTLVVWDLGQGRLTLFTADGHLVETIRPSVPLSPPAGFPDRNTMVAVRASAAAGPGAEEEILTNESHLVRYDLAGGAVPDTLATMGQARLLLWSFQEMMGFMRVPFTVDGSIAAGGGKLAATPGNRAEIHLLGPDGTPDRIMRVDGYPRPLSPEAFDAEVEIRIARAADDMRSEMRRRYAQMPVPEHEPVYTSLLIDSEGAIWAEHHRPDFARGIMGRGAASRWTVFGPDGVVIATADLPARFLPFEITEDSVLGVYQDDLDVYYIHRLALDRTPIATPSRDD